MSAIAPFNWADGSTPAVTRALTPTSVGMGTQPGSHQAVWHDRTSGVRAGFPSVTLVTREPSKSSSVYKLEARMVLPVLEVLSNSTVTGIMPSPRPAYTLPVVVSAILPDRSSRERRRDALLLLRQVVNEGWFESAFLDGESPY